MTRARKSKPAYAAIPSLGMVGKDANFSESWHLYAANSISNTLP